MVNVVLVIVFIILIVEAVRLFIFWKKDRKAWLVLGQREKELAYLSSVIEETFSQKWTVETLFPKLLNSLRENLGWTYHSIFRLDEDKQLVVVRFTGYLPDWYMKEFSTKVLVKVGDAAIGRAVATGQPVTINASLVDPRFKSVRSVAVMTGYKSLTCCPLIGKLKTHGGFCTYSEYENVFTLHDRQFLLICSYLYGAILEMILLQDYLERRDKLKLATA